jgi:hypothetical protein
MELAPRLPHNADAERAILGAVLLNGDALDIATSVVSPLDFFVRAHQRIFGAMQLLRARGLPIELVLLYDELLNDDEVNALGGAAYLASLCDGVYRKAPVAEWATLLRDAAVLRGIATAGQQPVDRALRPGATVREMAQRAQIIANSITPSGELPNTALVSITVEELLGKDIKPREMLLDPIIPEQGLVMMYSPRGVGKTWVALGIGASVAAGNRFLKWNAPRPRKVLYVDGELPEKTVQKRTAMILDAMEGNSLGPRQFTIITPDEQQRAMPDLGTRQGQNLIEAHLEGIDLLILDNLSALRRCGNENEGEAWLPVQEWMLSLRRRGLSVLFLHHAGKNRSQRGTSRREDLLDTVINLKHPIDYNPSEGLRAELQFEKTRAMLGNDAKPFEITMSGGEYGGAVWTFRELDDVREKQAAALFAQGMSVRDVAEELGISKSAAGRYRQRGKVVEMSCSMLALLGVNWGPPSPALRQKLHWMAKRLAKLTDAARSERLRGTDPLVQAQENLAQFQKQLARKKVRRLTVSQSGWVDDTASGCSIRPLPP